MRSEPWLASLLLLLVSAFPTLEAATIFVDATATGAGTGASWIDAATDLRLALAGAVSGDEVWVRGAPGSGITYLPATDGDRAKSFAVPDHVALRGGFAGGETLSSQADPTTNLTILSGDLNGNDTAYQAGAYPTGLEVQDDSFTVVTAGDGSLIDGFLICREYSGGAGVECGAVLCDHAAATISRCSLRYNEGKSINAQSADLTVVDCEVTKNFDTLGISATSSATQISTTRFWDSPEFDYTAIYSAGGSLDLSGCSFWNNNWGTQPELQALNTTSLTVTACVFSTADFNASGGFRFCVSSSSATFSSCIFTGFANGYGLIGMPDGDAVTFDRCIFCGNRGYGPLVGATANLSRNLATSISMTASNCLIVGNEIANAPVAATGVGSQTTVINGLIADNTSQAGILVVPGDAGAIRVTDGHASVSNSIVTRNQPAGAGGTIATTTGTGSADWDRCGFDAAGTFSGAAMTTTACFVADPVVPTFMTGTWAVAPVYDLTTGTCTYTASAPIVGNLAGMFLRPKCDTRALAYLIVSNTATTITAYGEPIVSPLQTPVVVAGDSFSVSAYRIAPNSPGIDAADAAVAPAIDLEGSVRTDPAYDDPTVVDTGIGSPTWIDLGPIEHLPGYTATVSPPAPVTTTAPIDFAVHFSRATAALSPDLLRITNGALLGLSGSGTDWTVSVAPTVEGSVSLALMPGAGVDAADSSMGSAAASAFFRDDSYNSPPTISAISDQDILEDAGPQTVTLAGIAAGAPGEEGQVLTVTATSSNHAVIPDPAVTYTSPDSSGSLSYAPLPDANGSALITVVVRDNGGTANGIDTTTISFTVTVDPVNDTPSFVCGPNVTVSEDAGPQTVPGWATAISAGPADEAGQALGFVVSNSNHALFSVQPAVSSTGTLTFTTAANANTGASGPCTVTVEIRDDGGGADTSAPQNFTITVTPVNDAPVAADVSASTTTGAPIHATLDGTDVDGDPLTYSAVTMPAHGTLSLSGDVATYTPNVGFTGTDTFTYQVNDGTVDSNVATVTMTVSFSGGTGGPVGSPTPETSGNGCGLGGGGAGVLLLLALGLGRRRSPCLGSSSDP